MPKPSPLAILDRPAESRGPFGRGIQGVLYEDINDPYGVGLLTFSESAGYFVDDMRRFLTSAPFSQLMSKPEHTMFGRTYSLGYEPD